MHTAPGDRKFSLFAVYFYNRTLNKKPVVGSQAVHNILFVRPVHDWNPVRIHFWKWLLRVRIFIFIYFFTGLDTGFASDTFSDVKEGGELFFTIIA